MEQHKRDWELVPISKALGMKFGYDIFPTEFKKIAGDLSLIRLSDPEFLRAKASEDRMAPIIRKGAEITGKIVETFLMRKCSVLPILLIEPKQLNALTTFAQRQTLMLSGRIFSCVDDWFKKVRKEKAAGVIQTIQKYRTPLLQSLNNALKDWEAVTLTLISDILVADDKLSILSIFDDFIGNPVKQKRQQEHSLEVAVLALMIARKCDLPVHELKDLGLASLIHDIGLVVYEQKLNEMIQIGGQLLEPDLIREAYNRHPVYGTILLSKKNGSPISGISSRVRSIVLEHEQKNDGAGPRIDNNEMASDLEKMGMPANIIYIGDNMVNSEYAHPKEVHFPGLSIVKRYMLTTSQILHVSELYVTMLDRFKRRNVPDPHKETLKIMLKQAGTKINGQVFEIFFNHLIPPDYYPENLVVTLDTRHRDIRRKYPEYHKHSGVIITIQNENGVPQKSLHVVKGPDGTDVKQKKVFNLNQDKKHLYLKIDDWSKYAPPR